MNKKEAREEMTAKEFIKKHKLKRYIQCGSGAGESSAQMASVPLEDVLEKYLDEKRNCEKKVESMMHKRSNPKKRFTEKVTYRLREYYGRPKVKKNNENNINWRVIDEAQARG